MKKSFEDEATRSVRRMVTGDDKKAIRLWRQQVKVAKLLDKWSFFMGVILMLVIQAVVLKTPEFFSLLYVPLILSVIASKWFMYTFFQIFFSFFDTVSTHTFQVQFEHVHFKYSNTVSTHTFQHKNFKFKKRYKPIKLHFFLIDLCYFTCFSFCIQIIFFPRNCEFFKMCYFTIMGAVGNAIWLWRNSMAFHDLDKMTSFYLHMLPVICAVTNRWFLPRYELACPLYSPFTVWDFVNGLYFYLIWQTLYIFLTCVLFR